MLNIYYEHYYTDLRTCKGNNMCSKAIPELLRKGRERDFNYALLNRKFIELKKAEEKAKAIIVDNKKAAKEAADVLTGILEA